MLGEDNSGNVQSDIVLANGETASVIGFIEIKDLNIKYPILSTTSKELLKISPCKFYGPNVNEVGNLCIAGHNYDDNTFFSNIYKLEINSKITLYDLNNNSVIYKIYNKYETKFTDTSSTNQNTNGKREITLITCNNFNGNRLILKALE